MTIRFANVLFGVAISALVSVLAACSSQQGLYSKSSYNDSVILAQGQDAARVGAGSSPARVAVTHSFSLRLPAAEVESVQRRHLDECARLNCIVVNTRIDRSIAGRVLAASSVRIAPEGFAAFVKALADPPAEVIAHSESTEDKTVPLLDLEKRVEMKSALRDRLTAMLKDPSPKSTADLLAIERELTQVQTEIESSIAQRDYLRTITETVHVDVNYTSIMPLTAGIDFTPIRQAGGESGQTMVRSIAQLITFLAAILPWVPFVLLLGWSLRYAFRSMRRGRREASAAQHATPATDAA
jgi:hypothetical protein